jgi:hypothetical protein
LSFCPSIIHQGAVYGQGKSDFAQRESEAALEALGHRRLVPAPTCNSQNKCIKFTVEEAESDDLTCGEDDCYYKVCLVIDYNLQGCGKNDTEADYFSHLCETLTPGGEDCIKDGRCDECDSEFIEWGAKYEANSTLGDVVDGLAVCQIVTPGDYAVWILKDGTGMCDELTEDANIEYENGILERAAEVACDKTYACGDRAVR